MNQDDESDGKSNEEQCGNDQEQAKSRAEACSRALACTAGLDASRAATLILLLLACRLTGLAGLIRWLCSRGSDRPPLALSDPLSISTRRPWNKGHTFWPPQLCSLAWLSGCLACLHAERRMQKGRRVARVQTEQHVYSNLRFHRIRQDPFPNRPNSKHAHPRGALWRRGRGPPHPYTGTQMQGSMLPVGLHASLHGTARLQDPSLCLAERSACMYVCCLLHPDRTAQAPAPAIKRRSFRRVETRHGPVRLRRAVMARHGRVCIATDVLGNKASSRSIGVGAWSVLRQEALVADRLISVGQLPRPARAPGLDTSLQIAERHRPGCWM